jgi:hypothetical protein
MESDSIKFLNVTTNYFFDFNKGEPARPLEAPFWPNIYFLYYDLEPGAFEDRISNFIAVMPQRLYPMFQSHL